jgi:signal peptidase I
LGVILGFLLRPFTFLYLNNAKLFWLYMAPVCLVDLMDWYQHTYFGLVFFVICPLHAYFVAKAYDPAQPRRWYSRWWSIIVVFLTILTLVIRSFFYEPFRIPATSMAPSYNVGDYIVVKKKGYGTYGTFGLTFYNGHVDAAVELERGKAYVFYPPDKDIPYLKRLIGLPGDKISIDGDKVLINGVKLETKKLYERGDFTVYRERVGAQAYQIKVSKTHSQDVIVNTVVPERDYFFLGDNRSNSRDSRFWGTVGSDRFIGEVVAVINTQGP